MVFVQLDAKEEISAWKWKTAIYVPSQHSNNMNILQVRVSFEFVRPSSVNRPTVAETREARLTTNQADSAPFIPVYPQNHKLHDGTGGLIRPIVYRPNWCTWQLT
jgi:hypothetical protein